MTYYKTVELTLKQKNLLVDAVGFMIDHEGGPTKYKQLVDLQDLIDDAKEIYL